MSGAAPSEPPTLTISANAAARLRKVLANDPDGALRVSVRGGGCSGFQYAFDIEGGAAADDYVATRDGVKVLVDPVSADLLKGSELDFVDDLMGQSFRVRNPNARSSCGCGVSFSL